MKAGSTEVTFFAEAHDYLDLHAAARARAEQLNVSRETIDDVAGLTNGYASKLLALPPIKKFGPISLGPTMRALGLKMIVVDDPEALAKVEGRLTPREHGDPRAKVGCENVNQAPELLKLLQGELGRRRIRRINQKLTPSERQERARRAARARWTR